MESNANSNSNSNSDSDSDDCQIVEPNAPTVDSAPQIPRKRQRTEEEKAKAQDAKKRKKQAADAHNASLKNSEITTECVEMYINTNAVIKDTHFPNHTGTLMELALQLANK
jgi:hypothetical protein